MIPNLLIFAFSCSVSFNFVLSSLYRLPNTVKPVWYNLTLEPNLEEATFNGSVTIDLTVLENTPNITFHARNLTLSKSSIKIVDENKSQLVVLENVIDNNTETYTIRLKSQLVKGNNYLLIIGSFRGSLEATFRKVGFYLAFYVDEARHERRFAVTDFEPADARQAFPCFDEPALKARFLINIIRPANYSSLSNEELQSTTYLGKNRYQDSYKETLKMSTYLVAVVVSDFQSTNSIGKHRIFARPQLIAQNEFSLSMQLSFKILRELENYTGIDFKMKSLKQVALPDSEFTAGGMENWGLITYRESFLSCTNSSTLHEMERCMMIIAHEFAHQWFGNLVTAVWWDYLWLNEGFATYFKYYIPSLLKPSWRFMDRFVIEMMHSAFEFDRSVYSSRALNDKISHVNQALNTLVYVKGGAVIRMAEHFLTQEVFKKGINIYLEKK